jgi:hypothetical protein
MNQQVTLEILQVATEQVFYSFAQDNLLLTEFALALFLIILRRVNNSSTKPETA